MINWLKFYFLGFVNDKYGKEGATRSFLNTILSLLLALFILSGGISAGYAASFSTHYKNATEFRSFVYSYFASDGDNRINLTMKNGTLSADIPDGAGVNTFAKDAEGYCLIVDTRPAATTFDKFTLDCKDANGVEISYEQYRELPEEGKKNSSVKFKYSGNTLDVTENQDDYIKFLNEITNKESEDYKADIALAYDELKSKHEKNEITDEEYANKLYVLYAKNYYPSYSGIEIYGDAPTLRTYYMSGDVLEGVNKYLIVLDDLCICSFKTEKGIPVDFGSYFTNVSDCVISADGMTTSAMQANVDNFIKQCFSSSGAFNFLVHFMNISKFILLLLLILVILALIVFLICKFLKLEFGSKFFGTLKIIGGYILYSSLITFILSIILSFVCPRNTIFIASEITVVGIIFVRTAALVVAEYIRKKRNPVPEAVPSGQPEEEVEEELKPLDWNDEDDPFKSTAVQPEIPSADDPTSDDTAKE